MQYNGRILLAGYCRIGSTLIAKGSLDAGQECSDLREWIFLGISEGNPPWEGLQVERILVHESQVWGKYRMCSGSESTLPSIEMMGINIHTISLDEMLEHIFQTIEQDGRSIVANVNVHAMNIAYENPTFRRFLQNSDVVFCDGHGVRFGAFLLGQRIPYRYTPPDWIPRLIQLCASRDVKVYFLGGRPSVAQKAADYLQRTVVGQCRIEAHHGFFEKDCDHPENRDVIEKINHAQADILVVGFGMPLQEQWIADNWSKLKVSVAIPAGAAFDYLSGEMVRGPRWMTESGLEWLARLLVEPRRLWKRYLFGNPLFLYRVLRQRFTSKKRTGEMQDVSG